MRSRARRGRRLGVRPNDGDRQWEKDPRVVEVVLRESRRVVRQIGPVLITETRHGFVCANSGVDQSSSGAHGRVLTLPVDADASARRARPVRRAGCRRRRGGHRHVRSPVAGGADRHRHRRRRDPPLHSYIGEIDPHGHEFRVQEICVADELAAAGELVKGNTSRIPVAVVRGYHWTSTTRRRWRPSSATPAATCSADPAPGYRALDGCSRTPRPSRLRTSRSTTSRRRGPPDVVLVHGITESRRTWDPLIAPLVAAGYRVLRSTSVGTVTRRGRLPYDLATMAGDLGAVLAHEGLDDALLVGHSLGGAVVSAYAAGGPCRAWSTSTSRCCSAGFKDTLGQLEADAERHDGGVPRGRSRRSSSRWPGRSRTPSGGGSIISVTPIRTSSSASGIWCSTRPRRSSTPSSTVSPARTSPLPVAARHRSGSGVRRVAHVTDPDGDVRGLARSRPLPPSGRADSADASPTSTGFA